MKNPNRRKGPRAGERGNAFVEIALGALPFFAIMFGIMDFSLVMFINNTLQLAVREGVRFAITYNTSYNGTSYGSQTQAVQAVVKANSMGFLNGSASTSYIHVNYYLPNNLSTPVTASALPQTMADGTVVTSVNQMGNVVEVEIRNFPWNWMVPLPGFAAGTGMTLRASSSDVLQGLPVGVFLPPAP